ncbi:UDP-2,4-diacetamido-2,4,6-trideoxy-beta-L-altropyranose hydrolase [Endozoicomonas sp. OPT23]|uniref:UDP-2,4-diacetamido-2,4, 6-trideoxy-beta-L-altropyranose hydrolase n=1 Tax=Endozoicomonas sp. OPT23 TaxID=2072845 RepID=UPI00129AFAB2|nr:UDP-2,4-diacetamido-2,4,6-trideoxy-beta-L-altropyranose hydrolase [Endozoicomonas sp. OPT23]MRI34298.1 UDP-2,4-diacetamido-2,4,6-trideoxy-beta-L-altropyranose hydrolase [Endozoicomonas sp. OPT23]
MKVVIRVDASTEIGTGHVMRCLTLANALKKYLSAEVLFICREREGCLSEQIRKGNFNLKFLAQPARLESFNYDTESSDISQAEDAKDTLLAIKRCPSFLMADWLIVDHYGLDQNWEKRVRPHCHKLMVIDDLANRQHCSDLLLDQNYYQNMGSRYREKVNKDCLCLLGPNYSLLREEFSTAKKAQWRDTNPEVLLFFGGADQVNATQHAIEAILPIIQSLGMVHVVVGASNPHAEKIKYLCLQHEKLRYHFAIDYMSKLMQEVQLFVGAVGSTTWERCAVGLPGIVVTVADNQLQLANDLDAMRVHTCLGTFDVGVDFTEAYQAQIFKTMRNYALWIEMQDRSMDLTDGKGCRAVTNIMELAMNSENNNSF